MPKMGFRRLLAIVCAMMLFLTACAGGVGILSTKANPVIANHNPPETEQYTQSPSTSASPTPTASASPTPTASASPSPSAPTPSPSEPTPSASETPSDTPQPSVPEPTPKDSPDPTPDPKDRPEDSNLSEEPEEWTPIDTLPLTPTEYAELPDILPEFYIAAYEERYLTFAGSNPDIPFDIVAAYVNAGVDIPHYTDTVLIDDPNNILVMCNKTYRLSSKYAPDDLVKIAGNSSMYLRAEAAAQWKKMYNDMLDDGLRVYPRSAYRSYSTQKYVYQNYAAKSGAARADTYSARAGHSEHQTGLTLDMLQGTGYSSLTGAHFEDTKQYKWLIKNAADYGYILRYPKGYEHITGYRYEPWHWRYVGIEAAQQMKNEGISTWEEYCGRYVFSAK